MLECSHAHRAQRSKVELERGGNDGKWIRSHSTITRTITNAIKISYNFDRSAQKKKKNTVAKSGH